MEEGAGPGKRSLNYKRFNLIVINRGRFVHKGLFCFVFAGGVQLGGGQEGE